MTTLHRATDEKRYDGPWSCWSEDREVAEAYSDNPGFGGDVLISCEVAEDAKILDLVGLRGRDAYIALARLISEDDRHEVRVDDMYDSDEWDYRPETDEEIADGWRDSGLFFIYEVWETGDDRVRDLLAEQYDWVRHDQETFPEGATTWVRLR